MTQIQWISDKIINATQTLLREACPTISGLQDVSRGPAHLVIWCRARETDLFKSYTMKKIIDWHFPLLDESIPSSGFWQFIFSSIFLIQLKYRSQLSLLYNEQPQIILSSKDVQIQSGSSDCGLFSIAFATALIFGIQSGEFMFDQKEMRSHLIKCLESRRFSIFQYKS